MNEETKDRGVKRAVGKQQTVFHLPSNFAYRTMLKIEEAARLRERKAEKRTLWATIAAAIFLIGISTAGTIRYFGNSIRAISTPIAFPQPENIRIPSFYLLLVLAVPLFILFDRWMRKQYFKHHS